MEVTCDQCGSKVEKRKVDVVRAKEKGMNLYCGRKCFGLSKRTHKSKGELIEQKRLYDMKYREKNWEKLKEQKAEGHKRRYDPVKQRLYNQENMQRHIEYCRRPEYVAKKKKYDQVYKAKKNYGEFWESSIILTQIEGQVDKYETSILNDNYNKSQKRRRLWKS